MTISVITKAELLYGIEVSPRPAQDAAALTAMRGLCRFDEAFVTEEWRRRGVGRVLAQRF